MAKKERNRRSARQARAAQRAELEAQRQASEKKSGAAVVRSEANSPAKAEAKAPAKQGKPGFIERVKNYFAAVRSEMKRVVWPSQTDLRNFTVGTVVILVVFGVAVWLVDTGIVAVLAALTGLRG